MLENFLFNVKESGYGCAVRLGCCLIYAAGCSAPVDNGNRPKVYKVSGTVIFQQKPVEGATVQFCPEDLAVSPAYGLTDANGNFQLQTFKVDDGAVAGKHRVTISKSYLPPAKYPEEDLRYVPPQPVWVTPEKYSEPDTSGLEAMVSESGKNRFTFELTE